MAVYRPYSGIFKINGLAIPAPDRWQKVAFESLADENSARTADGMMHINWLRRRLAKLSFQYSVMNNAQVREILLAVQGQEFPLTYVDPIEGIVTKNMYCSNSESTLGMSTAADSTGLWRDTTFNAIEK